jgi:hypothetical protein
VWNLQVWGGGTRELKEEKHENLYFIAWKALENVQKKNEWKEKKFVYETNNAYMSRKNKIGSLVLSCLKFGRKEFGLQWFYQKYPSRMNLTSLLFKHYFPKYIHLSPKPRYHPERP